LNAVHFQAPNGAKQNPVCADPAYESSIVNLLPKLGILDGEHIMLKATADSATNLPVKKELDIPDSERWCKDSDWKSDEAISSNTDATFDKNCDSVTDSLAELKQMDEDSQKLMENTA